MDPTRFSLSLIVVLILFNSFHLSNCQTSTLSNNNSKQESCCLPPNFNYKYSYMQTVVGNSSQHISGTFEYDFDAIGGKSRLDSYTTGPLGQVNVATNWIFLNNSNGLQLSYTNTQGSCTCVQIKKTHFDQICYPIGNPIENEKIVIGGLVANRLVYLEDNGQTRIESTIFNQDGNCWILNRNVFSKMIVQSFNYYNMVGKLYVERFRLPANCPKADHCTPLP